MMDYETLLNHLGHDVVIVAYGSKDDDGEMEIWNVALECEDCNEVLYSMETVECSDED